MFIPVTIYIRSNYGLFSGAFVPLTVEGNIVVDGVLASCYASADHDVLHYGMKPLVWFPEILQMVVGEDGGIPGYMKITAHLAQLVAPSGFVFKDSHFF